MKTDPQPRQHHEGEPPPESLIHHEEPTLLEQWFRRGLERGPAFWGVVGLIVVAVVAVVLISYRVGGPSPSAVEAWTELASVSSAPTSMSPFGPDPNAGLPERLREIADAHPGTSAARWAELRAATLLLNEGSAELATTRRSAGEGKIIEADGLFATLADEAEDEALRRMAALGRAQAAEARMGLDADDSEHAKLDDVLALYDEVIEQYPDTPEAKQAASRKRRLSRSDSQAFYEQLARYNPAGPASGPSGLPGMDLGPGQSSPLQDLLNLPPLGDSSAPGGAMEGLDLAPPSDLAGPDDPVGMPAPVPVPVDSPAPSSPIVDPGIGTVPVEPAPEPAGTPEPESPRVPDDPFGSTPTPTPTPSDAPQPEAEEPEAGGGGLPESVFPSGGPNG